MAVEMNEENLEILQEFILESQDMIQEAEELLLGLEALAEEGGAPLKEALDAIFRLFHSIKGAAGFLELVVLTRVTHEAESYMDFFRRGVATINPQVIDLLCVTVDEIKGILATVAEKHTDEPHEDTVGELVTQLKAAIARIQSGDLEVEAEGTEEALQPSGPNTLMEDAANTPVAAVPFEVSLSSEQAEGDNLRNTSEAVSIATTQDLPTLQGPESTENAEDKADAKTKETNTGKEKSTRATAEVTARVALGKLDLLMDLVGELIIAEAAVTHNPDLEGIHLESFQKSAMHLNRITRSLQDVAMSMRMVPVRQTFRRLLRVVRDVSRGVGKEVQLKINGEETEVDKSVVEALTDPLVHIIRNAVDHGMETPEGRVAAKKPPVGAISLDAVHQSGEVWISVSDDGPGLDRNKILDKARERGLVGPQEGEQLTDREIYSFLFKPGFSTAPKVTRISGRGVGLDVVRQNIEQLGGRVDIDSQLGVGTTFTLRIPLTLAIVEGMLVRVGNSKYTVPLLAVRETVRVEPEAMVQLPSGQEVIKIRDKIYPLVRLHVIHSIKPDCERIEEGLILVIDSGGDKYCLFVDEVLGQFQTVIKSLGNYLQDIRGISGCTILGNGEISLILDTFEMKRASQSSERSGNALRLAAS